MSESDFDIVIVGGGAAGLNAGLMLARARRRVAVVDAGEPRNAPAAHIHGFLSRDGTPPADLLAVGRAEVERYGGTVISDRADAVERAERRFIVRLASWRELWARRVLVTTGLRDELPAIPGVRDRWGRDVLHCPYCHGYEVRDEPVGVVGSEVPGVSVHHALLIRQVCDDVILFTHRAVLTDADRERLAARDVAVVDGEVTRVVVREDRVRGVELADGQIVPRSAVFVAPRFVPVDGVLSGLGCAVDGEGLVTVDENGRTSVPGVWAAGNVVNPRAQLITAAAAGAAAAVAINGDLVEEDVERLLTASPAFG